MILVTGGTGQVGSSLIKLLKKSSRNFVAPTRAELNLDTPSEIRKFLERNQITTIAHLAAETNVDFCEVNNQMALVRNLESTKVLADFAKAIQAPFIFISSSAVLSGDGQFMHSETANYSPANFYGTTKMLAEEYIRATCTRHLIIRASWMLGRGAQVKKFAEIAYEKISAGETFSAVYDKFGSLTSADGLAYLIFKALDSSEIGTLHYSSHTPCSRYDVAKYIKLALGSKSEIIPVSSSLFDLPAPRGFSEGLEVELLSSRFNITPKTWEDELDTFLKEL